jgi:hypothetical protein
MDAWRGMSKPHFWRDIRGTAPSAYAFDKKKPLKHESDFKNFKLFKKLQPKNQRARGMDGACFKKGTESMMIR